MTGVQLFNDETIISNTFLRRLQNPTEKPLDVCCQALIQIFVDHYGDKIEEIVKLGEKNLKEAEAFLTVVVGPKDFGANLERNPSRTLASLKSRLDLLKAHPYIIYENVGKCGKREYVSLPLVIEHKLDEKGNIKLVFNPRLRFHVSKNYTMKDNYALCSLSLLKEIKDIDIYAGILFEEGNSWANHGARTEDHFFCWSLQELRQKFLFDAITDLSADGKEFQIKKIRNMRVDNLINKYLIPALQVLEDFFAQGKINFWLEMKTYFSGEKKAGRPPKDSFRFLIHKKPRVTIHQVPKETIQLDIFDSYEEINNYTELRKEFSFMMKSKKYVNDILRQIQKKEAEDQTFSEKVLEKVRDIRTKYGEKKKKDEWRKILVTVLGRDFGIGSTPKKQQESEIPNGIEWPKDLDAKIEAMKQSFEICDRATREQNLSQEEVIKLLDNNFRAYCRKTNKPLKNWTDAINLFFNVINKQWLKDYEINENNGNNEPQGGNGSDCVEEEVSRYFKERKLRKKFSF